MDIPDIPNLIYYAIPFFIITLVIEIIVDVRENANAYKTKDTATSLAMGLGNVFLGLLSKAFVFVIFI